MVAAAAVSVAFVVYVVN